MIVRSIDSNNDWNFGRGKNDYFSNQAAVVQLLNTRLESWLGNCFFDQGAGVNWQLYLGGKDSVGLNLSIQAVILNATDPVTGTQLVQALTQLFITLNSQRQISIAYNVTTIYGPTQGLTAIAIPLG